MNPYKKTKLHQLAYEYAKDVISHFNLGNMRCVRIPSPRAISDLDPFTDEVQKCVDSIVGENVISVRYGYRTNFARSNRLDYGLSYFPCGAYPERRDMTPFHELHDIKEELYAADRYDDELRALSRERSKGKI